MKRVATGTHLAAPWLFEPAKRPDDRADYCVGWGEEAGNIILLRSLLCFRDCKKEHVAKNNEQEGY